MGILLVRKREAAAVAALQLEKMVTPGLRTCSYSRSKLCPRGVPKKPVRCEGDLNGNVPNATAQTHELMYYSRQTHDSTVERRKDAPSEEGDKHT